MGKRPLGTQRPLENATTVGISLPPDLSGWLAKQSVEQDRSMSAIVRRLIRDEMDRLEQKGE